MITVLTGLDSLRLERELELIKSNFDGQAETYDGADISYEDLSDMSMGMSLFSSERMVVIRRLSDSKLWADLTDWFERLKQSQTNFILVEPTLDKRTKAYKALQKSADVKTFAPIDERRPAEAYQYIAKEAELLKLKLTTAQQRKIVDLVGPDGGAIIQALDKLALYDQVSDKLIDEIIDQAPEQNVFRLFELVLQNNTSAMQALLADLRLDQEPHMLFGALTYQATAFAAIVLADGAPLGQVAADFGLSEYSLRNLAGYSHQWSRSQVIDMMKKFSDTDMQMKSSSSADWTMIEKLLTEISQG